VIRSFAQEPGVDYVESYSPLATNTTIKVVSSEQDEKHDDWICNVTPFFPSIRQTINMEQYVMKGAAHHPDVVHNFCIVEVNACFQYPPPNLECTKHTLNILLQ
jgi:hypothetical protein